MLAFEGGLFGDAAAVQTGLFGFETRSLASHGSDDGQDGWTPGCSAKTSPSKLDGVSPPPAAVAPQMPQWMLQEAVASVRTPHRQTALVSEAPASSSRSRPASALSSSDRDVWGPQVHDPAYDPWEGVLPQAPLIQGTCWDGGAGGPHASMPAGCVPMVHAPLRGSVALTEETYDTPHSVWLAPGPVAKQPSPPLASSPPPLLVPGEELQPRAPYNALLPSPFDELVALEQQQRAHIEAQVATRRRLVYSAIIDATSLDEVQVYLPDSLCHHDYISLALRFAILRGCVDIVEHIVARTAFRGYHGVAVHDLYAPDAIMSERGLPLCRVTSFVQLALECLLSEYLDAQRYGGRGGCTITTDAGNGAAVSHSVANREEILRLLMAAPGMCVSQADAMYLHAAVEAAALSPLLRFFAQACSGVKCKSRSCPNFALPAGYPQQRLPPPLHWSPAAHPHLPRVARQRITAACLVCARRGVTPAAVEMLLSFTAWEDLCGAAKSDPDYTLRTTVKDQVGPRIEALDASHASMARFASLCHKRTVPHAGMKVAVTFCGSRNRESSTATGHITGCVQDTLFWRPIGGLRSEALPTEVRINPLTTQDNPRPVAGDYWLCGLCMVVLPDAREKCRRCANTHLSVLALEAQRCRQGTPHGHGKAPPLLHGCARARPQSSRRGRRGAQRQWAHAAGGPLSPCTALNLSATPPRYEEFETAPRRLMVYQYLSGDVVCVQGIRGTVLGLGRDDALYWVQDGAAGATRLALTPEHFVDMLLAHRMN